MGGIDYPDEKWKYTLILTVRICIGLEICFQAKTQQGALIFLLLEYSLRVWRFHCFTDVRLAHVTSSKVKDGVVSYNKIMCHTLHISTV